MTRRLRVINTLSMVKHVWVSPRLKLLTNFDSRRRLPWYYTTNNTISKSNNTDNKTTRSVLKSELKSLSSAINQTPL